MSNNITKGLTHDSGTESYAREASNYPALNELIESLCEKVENNDMILHGYNDGFGLFRLWEVSLPHELYQQVMENIDEEIMGEKTDRALQEKGFPHLHYYGDRLTKMYARTMEDIEPQPRAFLCDDRFPPQTWDEIIEIQEKEQDISSPLMLDGLPF